MLQKTQKGVAVWTIVFDVGQDQKRGMRVGKEVGKVVEWLARAKTSSGCLARG